MTASVRFTIIVVILLFGLIAYGWRTRALKKH
jgi:hypothetical protein